MSKPTFVSWRGHGQVSLPAPGIFTGTTTTLFFVRGNVDAMQTMVDRLLNGVSSSAVRYSVFSPFVAAAFLNVDALTCPSEPFGRLPYREASIWMPLLESRRGHLLPRAVLWMPYIFPDATIPMVCGREPFGFNKSLGWITEGGDGSYICETTVFKRLASDCLAERARLMTVAGAGGRGALWDCIEDLLKGIAQSFAPPDGIDGFFTELAAVPEMVKSLLAGTVTVTNLKQFRDVVDSRRACYQALVDGPMTVTKFSGAWPLFGARQLTVASVESHQIIADLGFAAKPGADAVIPVDFALEIAMDFEIGGGEIVWEA